MGPHPSSSVVPTEALNRCIRGGQEIPPLQVCERDRPVCIATPSASSRMARQGLMWRAAQPRDFDCDEPIWVGGQVHRLAQKSGGDGAGVWVKSKGSVLYASLPCNPRD